MTMPDLMRRLGLLVLFALAEAAACAITHSDVELPQPPPYRIAPPEHPYCYEAGLKHCIPGYCFCVQAV